MGNHMFRLRKKVDRSARVPATIKSCVTVYVKDPWERTWVDSDIFDLPNLRTVIFSGPVIEDYYKFQIEVLAAMVKASIYGPLITVYERDDLVKKIKKAWRAYRRIARKYSTKVKVEIPVEGE